MLPILKGPQGCGKTKFIQDLTGNWYTDFNLVMKTYTKDEMEKLQRSWIIETTLETRNLPYIYYTLINEDTYRKPYQQRPGTYKRQCFFIATTNLEEIKGDWLFNVKQGPGVMNRDQIWAEIMHYFKGRPV
jgi:predicted P-loop ATPase